MHVLNFIQNNKKVHKSKNVSVSVFMLINLLLTGGPINELKVVPSIEYCQIFMSVGDYLRSYEPIRK